MANRNGSDEQNTSNYLDVVPKELNGENTTVYIYNTDKMNEEQKKYMRWEKEILSNTNCRYILHCIKTEITGNECKLYVENFTQNNLSEYIRMTRTKNKRFKESTIKRCLANLAQGLCYLHAERPDGSHIINRNLTPENIKRSLSGEFVIGDFHIARPYNSESSLILSNDPQKLRNVVVPQVKEGNDDYHSEEEDDDDDNDTIEEEKNNIKQKSHTIDIAKLPNYSAPEIGDDKYDAKVDMWSLGCIIYEMCTLKAPYTNNQHERHKMIKREDRNMEESKLCAIPKMYSKDLNDIINKLIKFNPDERLSSRELMEMPYVKSYIDTDFGRNDNSKMLENIRDLLFDDHKKGECKESYK